MPELPKAKLNMARIRELAQQGFSDAEIASREDVYEPLPPEQVEMARLTRELHAEGVGSGQEPKPPIGKAVMDRAFEAQGGARVRPPGGMSDRALSAGFEELFRRAQEGDPAAVFKRADESWSQAKDRWESGQR